MVLPSKAQKRKEKAEKEKAEKEKAEKEKAEKEKAEREKAEKEKAATRTMPGGPPLDDQDIGPQMGEEDHDGGERDRDGVGGADVKQIGSGEGNDAGGGEDNNTGAAEGNNTGTAESDDAGATGGDNAGVVKDEDAGAVNGRGKSNDAHIGKANDAGVAGAASVVKSDDAGVGKADGAGVVKDEDAGAVKGKDIGVGKGEGVVVGQGNDTTPGEGDGRSDHGAKDSSTDKEKDTGAPDASEAPAVEVTGLKELIRVIEAMGSTNVGEHLGVLVDKLRETPLYPAYAALESSWKKMLDQVSETEAGRVPLPPSPPLTPQEISHNSTQDPQSKPQEPTHTSPSKAHIDKGAQTKSPQPQPTSPSPSKSYIDHQMQTSHSPPKSYADHQMQTEQHQSQPTSHSAPDVHTNQRRQANPPKPARSTQPAQAIPPWDGKELKTLEAGITSLSSKLDSMSQAMSKMASKQEITGSIGALGDRLDKTVSRTAEEVKTSGGATKTRIEKVDNTVSQISSKLDASVFTLQQSIIQVQDAVAKKPASGVQNNQPESRPDPKTGELEAQVLKLHQVLDATRVELLQADIAFKVAFEGNFSDEAEAAGTSGDGLSKAGSGRDAIQIAEGLRIGTLRLISRCRALFNLIAGRSDPSDSAIMVGEWAKCVEHLKARELKVRKAIKDKEEATRELQFHRFLVNQIRRGFYTPSEWKLAFDDHRDFATFMEQPYDGFANIQLLAQEMYRLQQSRPRKPSSASKPKYEESRSVPRTGWAPFSV